MSRPPMSRTPAGRKDGGIKLLDINEQPLGYAQAKKRKRMQGYCSVCSHQSFIKLSSWAVPLRGLLASHHRDLGLHPGQSVWDLWWTKLHWDRVFFEFFSLICKTELCDRLLKSGFQKFIKFMIFHILLYLNYDSARR
jgi:hypothetical protein